MSGQIDYHRRKLLETLDYYGVEYSETTRNVVNVDCPFCPGGDSKQHCGIFTDGKYNTYCWKCHTSSNFYRFLHLVRGVAWADYRSIVRTDKAQEGETVSGAVRRILKGNQESVQPKEAAQIEWPPPGSVPVKKAEANPLLVEFMERRRLAIGGLMDEGVRVGLTGRYAGRLIIPIWFDQQLVAFQARDMTDRMDNKYLTEGDIGLYLYRYEEYKPKAPIVIVEGVLDTWRNEYDIPNVMGSFTSDLTDAQLELLSFLEMDHLILCWDKDAYWHARKTAGELYDRGFATSVVLLPDGEDPDSLGPARLKSCIETALHEEDLRSGYGDGRRDHLCAG